MTQTAGQTEHAQDDALSQQLLRMLQGYFLTQVVHVFATLGIADHLAILRNIHRVAASHSKLLIVERLLPSAPEPSPVHLMDLNMLVLAGGRERSRVEFESLLSSAGYRLEKIMPLPHFLNLIEAVRV